MVKLKKDKYYLEDINGSDDEKIQGGDGLHLSKGDIFTVMLYGQAWAQRQCMCCFRDIKNFERLNNIVQVILSMSIKIIESFPAEHQKFLNKEKEENNTVQKKEVVVDSKNDENRVESKEENASSEKATDNKDDDEEDEDDITEESWNVEEKDKLLQFVSKLFLMNFPLYMAYKHMVHEEINPQEANALGNYCEVGDTEVPLYLLRNVCFFCDTNGIQGIASCFDKGDPETLPLFVAHTLITIIANLRMWMNIPTIMQCIVPLRSHIIRYMCKLSDKDLRMAGIRNMTDLLWAAVKEPLDSQVTFDGEVLDLAFKYFTCSTLTIRLAGVSQLNNQINIYNENCNNESTNDAESIGNKIANWLIDNKLVEHIFGPNLHVEIIKQCQMILNFLAVEGRITNEHIDCIWAAAQLKHCSKQVHDILMPLIKNLDIERVQHLLKLVSALDIPSHTEQTLYLAYALIKRVWMSAGGPCPHATQQSHQSPQYISDVKEHTEFIKVVQEDSKSNPSLKHDKRKRKLEQNNDEDDDDDDEAKVPDNASSCEKKKCVHRKTEREGDEDWDNSSVCANSELSNISDDSLPSDVSDGERCYHHLQKRKNKQHHANIEDEDVTDCDSEDAEDHSTPLKHRHHHHHGCSHHNRHRHGHPHNVHVHKHLEEEEEDDEDDDDDEDDEELDSEQEDMLREMEMAHGLHSEEGEEGEFSTEESLHPTPPKVIRKKPHWVSHNRNRIVALKQQMKKNNKSVEIKECDTAGEMVSEEVSVSGPLLHQKDSEECSLLEEEEEEEGEIRKSDDATQKCHQTSPTTHEFVTNSENVETEVYDCNNYLEQIQAHRRRHMEGDFMEDILSPDDGSCNSSRISTKSEKNMADFEGEDVMSDDEIAHIHINSHMSHQMRAHAHFQSHMQQQLANIATLYHSHGQVPHGVVQNVNDEEEVEEHVCSGFSYEDVCKTGHTLLWDLVQEDVAYHLPEGLDDEAEKALFSLVCYSTDRRIRMKFIEACIDNLANHKSVVVSLKFLPKLLGSFQQFRSGTDSYSVLMWAEKELNMMKHFFNNLVHFSNMMKDGSRPPHSLYTFRLEVQVRLQFLSGVFSSMGSPDTFRLSIEQVDTLWSCLLTNPESTDECLNWFLSQAKSKDHHALGLDAFKHIFLFKMPLLEPENISMIGLNLFQQLCHLARIANASFDQPLSEDEISGMDQLWGIALKAHNTDVSMSAIHYLNNYYIMYGNGNLGKEEEFIQRCMESLSPGSSLLVIQRALILLKNHLESFRRRYAFHLRIWQLDNQGIISHQKLLQDRQSSTLRVVLQPAGLAEKTTIEMLSCDLVAELRAEVSRWWESLQKQQKAEKQAPTTGSILTPILGSMLGDGPVRMITLGQELTVDMDEKTLSELQFKDRQLVFISVGVSRHPRKQDGTTPASYLPMPNREQIPMMILLQEQFFEHLFNLLQELSSLHYPDSDANDSNNDINSDDQEPYTVETKARLLSHKVWELLMLLPTSHNMLHGFKSITEMKEAEEQKTKLKWDKLLDCQSPHKLMYSLQIVESLSRPPKHKWKKRGNSGGGGDYLPSSDSDDTSESESTEDTWSKKFIAAEGLWHMFHIFLSGCLQAKENETWNEWNQECLGYLLRLINQFAISQDDLEAVSDDVFDQYDTPRKKMKKQKGGNEKILIPRLNEAILSMVEVEAVMKILTNILHDAAVPCDKNQLHSSFARAEVVHYALSFMVSWAYSCEDVQPVLCSPDRLVTWLKRLTLDAPEPHVRREACMGLYRLCHGQSVDGSKKGYCFLLPLLSSLLTFLDYAKKMKPTRTGDSWDEGKEGPKEPYGPGCRDYFWLVCRLVENISKEDAVKNWEESGLVDLNSLASHVASSIVNKDFLEPRINTFEDDALVGLLHLTTSIMKHNPPFKSSTEGNEFLKEAFWCLFSLPSPNNRHLPKCKSDACRSATYDLLIEMVKGCVESYVLLHEMVLNQHNKGAHAIYPWDHWPHDDGRSNCGYVGLTNLGATCYMATCMQHLYMLPQARESVLQANVANDDSGKYEGTLTELKKMFAYLLESERKAYNPRGFCKVYTMDKQPLNTGEQKDMTEFFTDLISKLEEMSPVLKDVVKSLFGGVLSNNVVSLDCPHVSRTLEEFYTVRCQVADMKNLYESLDEVTVKDTLEGDNMYTCSKCQKKVRAEKRACFKSLPNILCFNTMRYTFNMVTMMKEKVNTHFSFPLRLSMEDYMEHNLIRSDKIGADDEDEDKVSEKKQQKDPNEESYQYELTGVTVHTGTADGGHYYSFIRDRLNKCENGQDKWFLFNDAEVKSFDPGQIAGECFGGEMTSKTYDSVTDKFMDFSFEKTNSAYMLFYERIPKSKDTEVKDSMCDESQPKYNFELSKELADWIWQDNMQFLQDKNIFEHTYFGFMWQMCGYIPTTLPRDESSQVPLLAAKLSASFVLETLIHAKEKPTMLQWIELLTKQFNSCPAACEWFLDHMANDDWWPQQILIKCPNQVVRQMFHRLLIHVITQLKPSNASLYLQPTYERENNDRVAEIGEKSCVTRLIKKMLSITQHGVKPHSKYLSEYFTFFLDFAKMGSEECLFLLQISTISIFVNFYMGHKGQDYVEIISDDEEEDDDVIVVTEDKFRPTSLEKMITLISILVEETRRDGHEVRLSDKDLHALVGGKGFPFLFNQIRDNVNLRQTCNLIFSLSRWNDRAAVSVVQMIFGAIAKLNQEQCQPFFKVLSMLVEIIGGPPGMPNFTRYVLMKFWEVVEYCPQQCLEWLSAQVNRNKLIHGWVMQHLEHWVEPYLIVNNNIRVRNAAAYLLVSLIPSQAFRQAFRTSRHMLSPLKEMNAEAVEVLHEIYDHLLRLLSRGRHYVDAATHGTNKLTSYFALMTYCLLSRTEKHMFSQYFMDLWQLFQPKLTEPPISMHHNKQALLIFWYQTCVDCPENVQLIVTNAHVTKNIAFNYILADHDDQEVVIFNRCMLPAYYGILRMCCQQSRSFTRQLAHHQNIQWAFKNITPYPAQYTAAVEELFKMMRFMVHHYPDTTEEEDKSINHFKRNTLLLYLQNLDARSNWQTLIPALKILVENNDDRMLLIYNNGLLMITEAFCTLHMMFHEATACHVTGDIVELLGILQPVIKMARLFSEKKVGDAKSCLSNWKEKMELIRKLITLLNTYTPTELRQASLDVLREMILTFQNEAISVILPIVMNAHCQFQENNAPFSPGPYFPRRGQKAIGPKSNIRPPRPQFQMVLHSNLLESTKGIDKAYDNALCEFFYPYHQLVDLMCRVAVNQQELSEQLVNLSAMVAYEGVALHSPYFAKLWYEIYHLEHVDKSWVSLLCKSSSFIDYVDSVLLDERQSLNNQFIFQFFTNYFPKVHQQVLNDNGQALLDSIVRSIAVEKVSLENTQCDDDILTITQKINGDLRALRLIFSVQTPKEMEPNLNKTLSCILVVCKSFQERKQKEKAALVETKSEETPSKKRKLSGEGEKPEKDEVPIKECDSPKPSTSQQKCDTEPPDSDGDEDTKGDKPEPKKLIPKEKPNSVDVVAKHIETLFEMVNKQQKSGS